MTPSFTTSTPRLRRETTMDRSTCGVSCHAEHDLPDSRGLRRDFVTADRPGRHATRAIQGLEQNLPSISHFERAGNFDQCEVSNTRAANNFEILQYLWQLLSHVSMKNAGDFRGKESAPQAEDFKLGESSITAGSASRSSTVRTRLFPPVQFKSRRK